MLETDLFESKTGPVFHRHLRETAGQRIRPLHAAVRRLSGGQLRGEFKLLNFRIFPFEVSELRKVRTRRLSICR